MSCIQISGAPLNFAQPQPVTATITPATLTTGTPVYTEATGLGVSATCRYRHFQNLGGTDVTIQGINIPPLASWTEEAAFNPVTNAYQLLDTVAYDATGGRLLIVTIL